ncbi:hypothetical protein ACX93W_23045 [Paenibacillus sp. CAU 1782]
MKCSCGRFIAPQVKALAVMYESKEELCVHCLAAFLNIPYQELVDRYAGIYECRPCLRDQKRSDIRRKLLGGSG